MNRDRLNEIHRSAQKARFHISACAAALTLAEAALCSIEAAINAEKHDILAFPTDIPNQMPISTLSLTETKMRGTPVPSAIPTPFEHGDTADKPGPLLPPVMSIPNAGPDWGPLVAPSAVPTPDLVEQIPPMYRSFAEAKRYEESDRSELLKTRLSELGVRPVPVDQTDRSRIGRPTNWLEIEQSWADSYHSRFAHENNHAMPRSDGRLPTVLTYLHMLEHPEPKRIECLRFDVDNGIHQGKLAIHRIRATDLEYGSSIIRLNRYMYNRVGRPWLWYERNTLTDVELFQYLRDPLVDFYVMSSGGIPVGFAEIDWRIRGQAELAYFGLYPEYTGGGYGKWFLERLTDIVWTRNQVTERFWVYTNSHDSLMALSNYEKRGFVRYNFKNATYIDPRTIWPDRMNVYSIDSYPWRKTDQYLSLYKELSSPVPPQDKVPDVDRSYEDADGFGPGRPYAWNGDLDGYLG